MLGRNNNGNNGNNNEEDQSGWISNPNSLRVRQEEQLAQDFRSVLIRHYAHLQTLSSSSSSLQNHHPIVLNAAERQVIQSLPFGWWQGALAGVVTLGVLRTGPAHLARFLQRRWRASASASRRQQQQQSSPPSASPFQKESSSNPSNTEFFNSSSDLKNQGGPVVKALFWALDVGLSFFAAATVTSIYTDHDRLHQELASIPLLPGTSPLCHELCPVAMETMQNYQNDKNTSFIMDQRPVTRSWQGWQAAVRNCQRRSAYGNAYRRVNAIDDTNTMIAVPQGLADQKGLEYLPLVQDAHGDVYNLKVWNTPRVSPLDNNNGGSSNSSEQASSVNHGVGRDGIV